MRLSEKLVELSTRMLMMEFEFSGAYASYFFQAVHHRAIPPVNTHNSAIPLVNNHQRAIPPVNTHNSAIPQVNTQDPLVKTHQSSGYPRTATNEFRTVPDQPDISELFVSAVYRTTNTETRAAGNLSHDLAEETTDTSMSCAPKNITNSFAEDYDVPGAGNSENSNPPANMFSTNGVFHQQLPTSHVPASELDFDKLTTAWKTFICPICSIERISKLDLTRHYMTHTGEKPFFCPVCNYRAIRKADIKKHCKFKHVFDPNDIFET